MLFIFNLSPIINSINHCSSARLPTVTPNFFCVSLSHCDSLVGQNKKNVFRAMGVTKWAWGQKRFGTAATFAPYIEAAEVPPWRARRPGIQHNGNKTETIQVWSQAVEKEEELAVSGASVSRSQYHSRLVVKNIKCLSGSGGNYEWKLFTNYECLISQMLIQLNLLEWDCIWKF